MNTAQRAKFCREEAEKRGHTVLETIPDPREPEFVSCLCQHPGRKPYFIHDDDGDVNITMSADASKRGDQGRHTFYRVPAYETIRLLDGLTGI